MKLSETGGVSLVPQRGMRMHSGNCFMTGKLSAALQVPPALNRFTKAADKNLAETVFKLLLKYRPEDKAAKKQRLLSEVSKFPQHGPYPGTAVQA